MKTGRRATARLGEVAAGGLGVASAMRLLAVVPSSQSRTPGSIARGIGPGPGEEVSGVGLRMSQMDRGDVVGMPLAGRNAASCRSVSP